MFRTEALRVSNEACEPRDNFEIVENERRETTRTVSSFAMNDASSWCGAEGGVLSASPCLLHKVLLTTMLFFLTRHLLKGFP